MTDHYRIIRKEINLTPEELELTIIDSQDKLVYLNKVAEVLLNLDNADPENRKLAQYDYAKMNLTGATTLEDVAHEVKQFQEELGKLIDDYEYEVRRVERFVSQIAEKENLFSNQQKNDGFNVF